MREALRSIYAFTVAVLCLGLVTACGDDDNPVASSGTASVPDHAGPNTAITTSNAAAVMADVGVAFNTSLGRVMSAAASKPAGKASLNQTITINDEVVQGLQSGTVTIKNGLFTLGSDGSQSLTADPVFDDFSEDGQLFMGGTVNLDLTMTLPTTIDQSNPLAGVSMSFRQRGDLAFSGKYKGVLSMDLQNGVERLRNICIRRGYLGWRDRLDHNLMTRFGEGA